MVAAFGGANGDEDIEIFKEILLDHGYNDLGKDMLTDGMEG